MLFFSRRSVLLVPLTVTILMVAMCLHPADSSLSPWDLYNADPQGPDYLLQQSDEGDDDFGDRDSSSVDRLRADIRQLLLENLLQEKQGRHDSGSYGYETAEKRGRWQGFCFRRTRTGRRLPYICWRESES